MSGNNTDAGGGGDDDVSVYDRSRGPHLPPKTVRRVYSVVDAAGAKGITVCGNRVQQHKVGYLFIYVCVCLVDIFIYI